MPFNLLHADDIQNELLMSVFHSADNMLQYVRTRMHINSDKILALLFFEPSTRTRLSFETAALRIGAATLVVSDQTSTSVVKGESLRDTAKMINNYADVVVIRHPLDGASAAFAEYATIPVINGGDGSHEHPTQAIIAVYTILKKKKSLKSLRIGLYGDLMNGRTAHSLSTLLARLGANLICISPKQLQFSSYLMRKLTKQLDANIQIIENLSEVISDLDVLYVTRPQRERMNEFERKLLEGKYGLTKELLRNAREDLLIMHPLPRTNELPYEIDNDRRAIYFEQAFNSVPVRMAILQHFLHGSFPAEIETGDQTKKITILQKKCKNIKCVTNFEAHLVPKFYRLQRVPGILFCYYCDHEQAED